MTDSAFSLVVAADRKLAPDAVKTLIDGALHSSEQAKAGKLVDEVASFETFRSGVVGKNEWTEVEIEENIASNKLSMMMQMMRFLGTMPPVRPSGKHVAGSTDMGNVSYLVPSIHPMIQAAPEGVPIHSVDFARCAVSPQGDQAVLDGAKAMAMTIVDLWASASLRHAAHAEFELRPQGVAVI